MTPIDWPTPDLLTRRARTTPGRLALVDADGDERWSYRELSREVDEPAHGLDEIDADRLALLLETGPGFVRTLFAAMRTRTTVVPLSTRERVPELDTKCRRTDADAVVCESSTASIADGLPVESVYALADSMADLDGAVAPVPRPSEHRTREPSPLDADWTQLIGFTSGTSGEPKAVRLTLANLVASATASALRLGVDRDDRWLVTLPMYHMGGLAPVVRTAIYGTTLVTRRTFEPASTSAVISEHDVTGLSLVPTMLRRLLDADWNPPTRLRFVLLGGAPARPTLLERSLAAGVPVYPTYGTTETASQVATATPAQVRENPESVGQPLFGTEVTVVEPGTETETAPSRECEPGETGEIVVSGPTVMAGYLDDEQTAAVFGECGFHTGDLGTLDEDGFLTVSGRVSDRIVTGGENVDPAEVRQVLTSHPAVEAAAVVGIPDVEWGERVGAVVVPADQGEAPSREALDRHCAERLAGFKRPRTLAVVNELPLTASGTVDRAAVRERLDKPADS